MLLYAPPLSPLSQLFHSQLHRKVMNDSSGLRGGKGPKDSIWALWASETLREFEDGNSLSRCWVVDGWENAVNMRTSRPLEKMPLWPHRCLGVSKGYYSCFYFYTFFKALVKEMTDMNHVKRVAPSKPRRKYGVFFQNVAGKEFLNVKCSQ